MTSRAGFICEVVLVLCGLVGAIFNACGSWWGFAIWLPCNIGFAVLYYRRGFRWTAALFWAYALTATWGIARALELWRL